MDARLIFSDYVSVEHYEQLPGNKLGYTVDASMAAIPVNIQPASSEVLTLMGGAFGKAYTVYTTSSGILESDRLTTVSGLYTKQYIVKGRENFNYGPAQHQELYTEKII